MMLTLTASIMYWSLQQGTEELDMCPSPSDTATTSPNASPAPSISGEDYSYYSGEVSSITFDDGEMDGASTADSAVNSVTTSYTRGANISINDGEGSTLTFDDDSYVDSDIEVTSGSPLELTRKVKPAPSNGDGSTVTYDNSSCDKGEPEVSSHL